MPEHPAIEPGVVDGALLFSYFGRAVRRFAQRERLQPWPHPLAREPELRVALVRLDDRRVDGLVWLCVWAREVERAARVVRRVDHRQQHVGHRRQVFPVLAHLECPGHGGHEAEDVGRRAHAKLGEAPMRDGKEVGERLGLGLGALGGEHLGRQRPVRLGKANVVELHFAESEQRRFFGHANVVVPQLALIRIHPEHAFLVAPRRAVPPPDVPRGVHARRDGVLEDDDSGDRQDVMRAERVEQCPEVRYHAALAGVPRDRRIGRGEVQPELVLDVDDERIDLGRVGDGDQLAHPLDALGGEAIHVEAADDGGVGRGNRSGFRGGSCGRLGDRRSGRRLGGNGARERERSSETHRPEDRKNRFRHQCILVA